MHLDIWPEYGYIIAKMEHEIVLAPHALADYKALAARDRAEVRDALITHLRHQPEKVGKSRIKRLRGLSRPQFRLRVGDLRVFYDVTDGVVEILAIVPKTKAGAWLSRAGDNR